MKFDFETNVRDGQWDKRFQDNVERYLATMPDGPVKVVIKKYRRSRSGQQNKYYWGVVVPILADFCGYNKDEMHDALKFQFLRIRKEGMPDACKSTTKLTTDEFNAYVEEIQRWAATELSVYIPDPNEAEAKQE